MPNIIVNNYCNQACSYCFANANMKDASLQKNMTLGTYLNILKYLKYIGDNNVRILGGEPIIFPQIRKFIDIANKGGFNIIVFSNINIRPEKFQKILSGVKNIRINCNINDEDFYTDKEKEYIQANLEFLQSQNIKTILGYNITSIFKYPDFHIHLAQKYKIKNFNLKITNTPLGEKIHLNTGSREFGKYIFNFIKKNYLNVSIELSCGLSPHIFLEEELDFIKKEANIRLFFGCEGHRGRFDINTDGSIFKCYPLESLYLNKKIYISNLLKNKTSFENTLDLLYKNVFSLDVCSAHKIMKSI